MHLLIVLVAAAAVPFAVSTLEVSRKDLDSQWDQFKKDYGKTYAPDEEPARRILWEETVERVRQHNLEYLLGNHSYTMAVNRLADMKAHEYRTCLLGFRQDEDDLRRMQEEARPHVKVLVELPDEVDWRKEGYVTPVKDQKNCSSCWAFSATGSLEGQHFKKTGTLVSLSEQNLLDCVTPNHGCQKGNSVYYAFKYIKKNGGIDTEESYPYEAKPGDCRFDKYSVGATLKGWHLVKKGSEDDMLEAVASVGPLSVVIDARHQSFYGYKKGIYNNPECSSEEHNHVVLVVGYGSQDGHDYWLVKNSWGTTWGMKGYMRISRNNNQCGIANWALYPVV